MIRPARGPTGTEPACRSSANRTISSRARAVLEADLPGLTDQLVAAGCVWMDPLEVLPPFITDREPRPGDERFRYVTGRRPVVEAVFAHAARDEPGVVVKRAASVKGLLRGAERTAGVTHVEGVLLDDGEELRADLVVDAMGRRTKLADWLTQLDAPVPYLESEDSGFVYYTRYFRGPALPARIGPPLIPFGTMSLLTLEGDNDTWSVTIWGSAADAALRELRDPARFTRVVQACPLHAHWLDGEPITDVLVMAGIMDRYRRFVVDDRPVATGIVAVGDAWTCTNPSGGRGISVGLLHAQRLRDSVRDGIDDAEALVRGFDARTEADVTPFVRNQFAFDRRRIAEMNALREGTEPPAPDPDAAAVGAAMLRDPDVFRGFIETIVLLGLPQEVFARPGFMDKVAKYAGEAPLVLPGPDRTELLALLA